MFGKCKRCGGPLFLEFDLGRLVVANCINCGYEQYLTGALVGVQDAENASVTPETGAHNYSSVNGCDRWHDCLDCPFRDCLLAKNRKALRARKREPTLAK